MRVYLCRYGVVVTLYLTMEGFALSGVPSSSFWFFVSFFISTCAATSSSWVFSPALHPSESESWLTCATCADANGRKSPVKTPPMSSASRELFRQPKNSPSWFPGDAAVAPSGAPRVTTYREKVTVMEGKSPTEKPEAFILTSSPGCCDGPGDGSGGVWEGAAGETSRRSSGSACFIWRSLVWFMAGFCTVLAVEARHPASLALCKGKICGVFLRAK